MTESANPEWWTKAIQDRMSFLKRYFIDEHHAVTMHDALLALGIQQRYSFGPRHEENRTGRLHADLIKLTDKYGYKEGKP